MTDVELRRAAERLQAWSRTMIFCEHTYTSRFKLADDLDDAATRLLELLPPADDGDRMPFDAWSFVRDVLSRGVSIEQDSRALGRTYEQFSARLDAVARELADKLKPHLRENQ